MPPIALLTGGLDFSNKFIVLRQGAQSPGPYSSLADAKAAGAVSISYGMFINAVVAFLLMAIALFIVVRWINRLRRPDAPPAPTTKPCPFCMEPIHKDARRCSRCTSELQAA
jgi:large conductance mechanosensitive channel